MLYIIDANNLAGKLKMLGDKYFDKKLIEMTKDYVQGKKNEIIIVFDPKDEWGDKKAITDKITVVYSPKDSYYRSADDKIVEIINQAITTGKDEISLISDDTGLKSRVRNISEETGRNINFIKATEYANKLLTTPESDQTDQKEELDEAEIEKISKELLDIWK